MGFGEAIKSCLGRYVDFGGRSSRSEFWWYYLFIIIVTYGLYFILIGVTVGAAQSGGNPGVGAAVIGILLLIFALGTFLPTLAACIRRLHDTGRSGWWLFISLVPLVGIIVLIVFWASASKAGDNDWGPEPAEHARHRAKQAG